MYHKRVYLSRGILKILKDFLLFYAIEKKERINVNSGSYKEHICCNDRIIVIKCI